MADIRGKHKVVAETSEAQIAVHWQEEEYYYPSAKFVGQANLTDPGIIERFSEENFPDCFHEYADILTWDQYWHTTLDTSDPPFWKWFCRGKAQRLLQPRRPAPGQVQKQSRLHLCAGASRRAAHSYYLSRIVCEGE